jgi:hypothetical protein
MPQATLSTKSLGHGICCKADEENKSLNEAKTIHHNIDHLVIKNSFLHCWGWVFEEAEQISELHLQCNLRDGRVIIQPVMYGSLREDVYAHFKNFPQAESSGFLINAAWEGSTLNSALLLATTINGRVQNIQIIEEVNYTEREKRAHTFSLQALLPLGARALKLLRQKQYNVLLEKAKRYWSARPISVHDPFAELTDILKSAKKGATVLLIIDHDLGGGAPQYRKQYVDKHIAQGGVVLLLSFYVPTLSYVAQIYGAQKTRRLELANLDTVLKIAQKGYIDDIFFNNAVSFYQPDKIPNFLISLHSMCRGRLTLAIHDFYMLCPSHFLLNSSGRFCNLPDASVCATCLQKNQEGFVSFYPSRDINNWRHEWGRLISDADEIIFFSHSTLQMFSRIYPGMPARVINVVPHSMDYFESRKIPVSFSDNLHIGIVGNIGRHKGSKIVAGLAKLIAKRELGIKITIFGSIDEPVPKNVVRITGIYEHVDLPGLIADSGVNLFFIPSIYPETFSYVTHEIVSMDLPFVCFDLGAQAEVAKAYQHGRVIQLLEDDELLDELCAAFEKIQESNQLKN